MVREANMKQATSEKQLKEAWGKVRPIPVCLGQPMAPGIARVRGYYPHLARACNRLCYQTYQTSKTGEPKSGTGRVGLKFK